MSKIISGCIYCGSTNHGKSCIFGPQNVHVIPTPDNRCIYCGSSNIGAGCPFNPYGNVHVRSATFANRPITEKLIILKHFLENKNQTNSNLDKFYSKLAEKINYCIDPLIHTFLVQEKINPDKFDYNLEDANNLQKDLINLFEKIDLTLNFYRDKLPLEIIEKEVLNTLIKKHAN